MSESEKEHLKNIQSNCFWAGFLNDLPKDTAWQVADEIVEAVQFALKQANGADKSTDPALRINSVSGSDLLPIKPNDPMPWEGGEWDGLRSDLVAVLTDRDEWHIGRRYSGYMDGADFDDWYTPDDHEIQGKVVGWVKLPLTTMKGEEKLEAVKTYKIFTEKYSKIIQAENMPTAIFRLMEVIEDANDAKNVIAIVDVKRGQEFISKKNKRELLIDLVNYIEDHFPIEFDSPEDVVDHFAAKKLIDLG